MKSFNRRVVAITGAASGIGRSLAIQLAGQGANLALADMNIQGLAETQGMVAATGVRCSVHHVDVADREAVEDFAREVVTTHGEVHAVFNNAGVTVVDSVQNQSFDDFNWVMNINFWGVVYCTRAFLPYLNKVDEAHIVNVSSVFGLLSMPLQSAYNSSKFAVRGFTEALKMELAGSHIQVSCIHPGGIRTGITKNSRMNERSMGTSSNEMVAAFEARAFTTADQAAAIILKGVLKNRRRILVGKDAKIMSLLTRIFPGSYERVMGLEQGVRRGRKTSAS